MSFLQIMDGLESSHATGTQAMQAARMGFLQWACAVDGPVTAQMARVALESPAARQAESAAARAFVGFLQEASRDCLTLPMRRSRARVLH
ncbi:hypothetical protein [Roseovarius sp.]|uniref:hypothetical protein n=1 Tax=Roseovarius sp. TaxID=1486281 RepID=UPI003A96C3E5